MEEAGSWFKMIVQGVLVAWILQMMDIELWSASWWVGCATMNLFGSFLTNPIEK